MKIFPDVTVQHLGQCEPGDFAIFSAGSREDFGLVTAKDEKWVKILCLNSDSDHAFKIVQLGHLEEILSYGSDLEIDLSNNRYAKSNDATTKPGSIVVTDKGTFIVTREAIPGVASELFYRIEQPEVVNISNFPRGGFAYKAWKLHLRNDSEDKRQLLAEYKPAE